MCVIDLEAGGAFSAPLGFCEDDSAAQLYSQEVGPKKALYFQLFNDLLETLQSCPVERLFSSGVVVQVACMHDDLCNMGVFQVAPHALDLFASLEVKNYENLMVRFCMCMGHWLPSCQLMPT